jgi:hypothetical protein
VYDDRRDPPVKRLLAVFALAVTMAAVGVAAAPAGSVEGDDQRPALGDRPPDHRIEHLRLGCRVIATDAGRGVGCDWSSAEHPRAESYALVRSVAGMQRTVVYRGPAPEPSRHFDSTAVAGTRMIYRVLALDARGRIVGESRIESVIWPVDTAVRDTVVRDNQVRDDAG